MRAMATTRASALQRIDFNCDLGEGCGGDAAIIPLISSASIACGGHAGDTVSMRATVELCQRHGVAIGAHPSFDDRGHFGRRELTLDHDAIRALVTRQVEALAAVCRASDATLRHVKPHGALYNLAARETDVAAAIAGAVRDFDPALLLYGLAGSELTRAGAAAGLQVAQEVFAERRYEADGRLTPRGTPGAVIEDLAGSIAQVLDILRDGRVLARNGEQVPLQADTLCLHGDRPDAPAFAQALRDVLQREGIVVAAPEPKA
jgi:5-oxoprolinase (ATP-hydrolysing) subunit A